mgnify:CR=1 FL=1
MIGEMKNMSTIELEWEKAKKEFDKEIEAIGIKRALLFWIYGGEVVLSLQKKGGDAIRKQLAALAQSAASANGPKPRRTKKR